MPLNVITFKGPFSQTDIYNWVSNILPDFPKITEDEGVNQTFKKLSNSFLKDRILV